MLKRMFLTLLIMVLTNIYLPVSIKAKVTPDDLYQSKRANFKNQLLKIPDPAKRQLLIQADQTLYNINQIVCNRFATEINKMAAILEEEKTRLGVTQTVVAYGQGDTLLDSAAYSLNYAAEALAFQKAQDYTPDLQGTNLPQAVNNSAANLKGKLKTLQNKILQAKTAINKALDYYEK